MEEGLKWAKENNDEEIGDSGIERYTHTTLVIVPSALLMNSWLEEIKEHLLDTIKVVKHHGHARKGDPDTLSNADIVLTTYKTLAVEAASKKSPLHQIGWFRIVLDEAHNIRHLPTTFHRSCSSLDARSRWCLTGTPIQNGLEDIGALFAFLRAEPFHSLAQFRRFLVVPFEQRDPIVKERLVLLYDSLVLRRTKDILHLPGQEEEVRLVEFSPQERALYASTTNLLARYLKHQVGEYENDKYFGLFQIHLQLRLLCNHGTHQSPLSWKNQKRDSREAVLAEVGLNAERLDFDENCKHIICADCLEDLEKGQGETLKHCPLCKPMDVVMQDRDGSADSEPTDDSYFNPDGHSTKMRALIEDVKATLHKEDENGNLRKTKTKSIIFSCWTRTLNLIERYLKAEKIEFLRIDGECLLSKRQRILDRFSKKGGPRVMLMTTGTGAFGLNLTAASRIFIVELQWNPSVEMQAIARAIRIRQEDKVLVTRYMVANTVEQQMESQQLNKRLAAQVGFGAGQGESDMVMEVIGDT
ncbi:SMARCA3-like protein [Cladobotryum mycophilum]|uniref:SMARCA3-like protein n=1 Tax=Cladobotryum mycophilum TaxID=491253 RepID=A0ABR0SP09_9HYPO